MKPPRVPRQMSFQGFPPSVRLIGIGWYFAVCVVLGVGVGVLLDKEFGTKPALTLVGLALGLIFAFYGGYLQLRDVLAEMSKRQKEGQ